MDLYSVDITTPLREDEVLKQPTHHVVTNTQRVAPEDKPPKKSKKSSKDSTKKSSGKSKKSDAMDPANDNQDLLSLDWENSNNLKSISPMEDLLDIGSGTSNVSQGLSSTTPAVAAASSKKSGVFVQRLISNASCEVLYHVTAKGSEVVVKWKCSNLTQDTISVVATLPSSPLIAKFHQGQTVEIASRLTAGSSFVSESSYSLHHPLTDHIALPCNITINQSSLIGQDSSSLSGSIHFHPVSSFSAYKLTEGEFQEKIAKSSNKWSSTSIQVPTSSKPKTAFKGIAGFLHAYLVESESSKAVSMSAKTMDGCKVFVLAKSFSGYVVQVDIKCLGSDISESQLVANMIAASLREIVV